MEPLIVSLYPEFSSSLEGLLDPTGEWEAYESDEDISINQPQRSGKSRSGGRYARNARAMAATLADIKEYPDSYELVLDMPGCKREDIQVKLFDENLLVITGKRSKGEEKEGVKHLRVERRAGRFLKKFALPDEVKKDEISAKTEDGVLTVTIPKIQPEAKKARTIEVKVK